MNQFEISILLWVQEHRIPALDVFNQAFTLLEEKGIVSILICLIFLFFRRYRKYGICCSLSLLIELILNNGILKNLVQRIRPYDIEQALNCITIHQSDFSFPSGHTGAAFAVAWSMLLMMPKKWGIPAVIFAVIMALSRIYVGVHYPTDVLAGAALGIITSYIARSITEWLLKKKAVRERIL